MRHALLLLVVLIIAVPTLADTSAELRSMQDDPLAGYVAVEGVRPTGYGGLIIYRYIQANFEGETDIPSILVIQYPAGWKLERRQPTEKNGPWGNGLPTRWMVSFRTEDGTAIDEVIELRMAVLPSDYLYHGYLPPHRLVWLPEGALPPHPPTESEEQR